METVSVVCVFASTEMTRTQSSDTELGWVKLQVLPGVFIWAIMVVAMSYMIHPTFQAVINIAQSS